METLVPLSTPLFPPALAIAFGLPSLSDGSLPSVPSAQQATLSHKAQDLGQQPAQTAFNPSNWSSMHKPPQQQQILPPFMSPQQGLQPTTSGSSVVQSYGRPVHAGGMYMAYPPPYASALPSGYSVMRGTVRCLPVRKPVLTLVRFEFKSVFSIETPRTCS